MTNPLHSLTLQSLFGIPTEQQVWVSDRLELARELNEESKGDASGPLWLAPHRAAARLSPTGARRYRKEGGA